MDTRKLWRGSEAADTADTALTYRAEIVLRDSLGNSSVYYDGGEFAPYCVESLLEILRAEAHRPHDLLDVSIEIKGPCTGNTLREIATRFAELREQRLHVRIAAAGHPSVVIAPEVAESDLPSRSTSIHKIL